MSIDYSINGQFRWQSRQNDNNGSTVRNVQRISGSNASRNTWYHIVGTCSPDGDLKLYINDSSHELSGDGTNNVPAELFNTTDLGTPIHKIGNGPGNPGNHKGHIRYLRIWGRELTNAEIEDVYTNRDDGGA